MASGKYKHNRQYDLVIFGATGYTGLFTAEHVAAALPTDLNWAVAGRSREKLEKIVADLKAEHPDRRQPAIEICSLDDDSLTSLAKKTFILATTVGPYCVYGEHAFKACAEQGTHYMDATGELPWVQSMIQKYEDVAKGSGALMFPQIGVESAPMDLVTWTLASVLREELQAPTRDVTLSIHRLNAVASGGTLATVLTLMDKYSLKDFRESFRPYALSPVPNPTRRPRRSLLTRLTGLVEVPNLGLLTTSIAGGANTSIVQRSWGLLSSIPSRRPQFYGPRFSYSEYMRARGRLLGFGVHFGIAFGFLVLALFSPLRSLVRRFVYQPGQGVTKEAAKREDLELRAVANADLEGPAKQAYSRATFRGSMYMLTGALLSEAAMVILEGHQGLELEGGVYTAACLGQPYIDRLDKAGFKIEKRLLTA